MILPNGTSTNTDRPGVCEVHNLARAAHRQYGTVIYRCPRCLEIRRINSARQASERREREREHHERDHVLAHFDVAKKLEALGIDAHELKSYLEGLP